MLKTTILKRDKLDELSEDEIKDKLNNFLDNFFKNDGEFFKIQKQILDSMT